MIGALLLIGVGYVTYQLVTKPAVRTKIKEAGQNLVDKVKGGKQE